MEKNGVFNKDFYDELKTEVKEINKNKALDDRIAALITFKNKIHAKINDEVDEILSFINLKKSKEED